MKDVRSLGQSLDKRLRRYANPVPEEADADIEGAWRYLRAESERSPMRRAAAVTLLPSGSRSGGVLWRVTAVAATFVVAVLVYSARWSGASAAVVEAADAGLHRVVAGNVKLLRVGESVGVGETIRSGGTSSASGRAGGVLKLADGSRVEMRSDSELALERAHDGARIRLESGGIIVNVAKQGTGHLYVQTKDMTVSVVGTVFLVNADDEGSRVAVIEGEVRVTQAAREKTLRSGEQVVTNALVNAAPVNEAILWSRNAAALVSLLHQAPVVPPALSPQNATALEESFELVAIRPGAPPPAGGRGSNVTELGCTAGGIQIDAGRFAATNINLYTLVAMAYGAPGRNCAYFSMLDVLSGGPGWVKSDRFDIQAAIPRGGPGYTLQQVQSGDAPRLQAMLRALLTDRFKLVVHRERRDVPVFVLTMARTKNASEFDSLAKQTTQQSPLTFPDVGETVSGVAPLYTASPRLGPATGRIVYGRNAEVSDLVIRLAPLVGSPVLDRTGLTGRFSFDVRFETAIDTLPGIQALTRPLNSSSTSALIVALRDQLGLELEGARGPVEALVIERAERPTEN